MSILCIGQTAYDITMPIQEAFIENQKYCVHDKLECLGGPAANAAYLCAKWKAETILITRLGKDAYGKKIIEDFNAIGINTDYMIYPDGFETPLSLIINNQSNGSRTIFNHPGKLNKVDIIFPSTKIDVILVDGHELEISLEAIKKYPEAISILDAGTCKASTVELAKVVDYLVCSQDFAKQYIQRECDLSDTNQQVDIMSQLKKLNKQNVIITLGENGLLYEADGIKHLPAYRVNAIDTTGAGDVFHGSFAYAMYKKMDLLEALKLASMSSAISVTRLGSQPSIPSYEEVTEAIENRLYNE